MLFGALLPLPLHHQNLADISTCCYLLLPLCCTHLPASIPHTSAPPNTPAPPSMPSPSPPSSDPPLSLLLPECAVVPVPPPPFAVQWIVRVSRFQGQYLCKML